MKQLKLNKLLHQPVVVTIYVILVLAASIQSIAMGDRIFEGTQNQTYTHYNNYEIFSTSFFHLIDDQDLFQYFPEDHYDLYKYSPTFAALFGVFSYLPDWLGLTLWNALNAFTLLIGIYMLPHISKPAKGAMCWIAGVELLTSMQNSQSNGLIAGLLILGFAFAEKNNISMSVLMLLLSVSVKIFGIVGFVIYIFYPDKLKTIGLSLAWGIVLLAIPLLFVSFEQYAFLMQSWWNLLGNDHSASYGLSVMGILHTWFGFDSGKSLVTGIGIVLLLVPLLKPSSYASFTFRLWMSCSVLIWVIIFNHKAESPTFVIAMAGIGIWFMYSEKSTTNIILLVFAMVLTSLSPTDFFPRYVLNEYVKPYALKALPCIIIWFKILYEQLNDAARGKEIQITT